MQKVKYVVTGITREKLKSIAEQLKHEENQGIVVLIGDTIPDRVTKIGEDGKVESILFGQFIDECFNHPEDQS